MEKFVEYRKLSKKKKQEINAEKRKTWESIKPIVKVKPSAKIYNRKNKQALMKSDFSLEPVCLLKLKDVI